MSKDLNQMQEPVETREEKKAKEKKVYSKPVIKEQGSVEKITLKVQGPPTDGFLFAHPTS